MKSFIKGIFCDENGLYSSKRFVGVLSSLSLIFYMFMWPSINSNNTVLILALGGLGLSSVDKIFKPK
jgi:hypothetical protein